MALGNSKIYVSPSSSISTCKDITEEIISFSSKSVLDKPGPTFVEYSSTEYNDKFRSMLRNICNHPYENMTNLRYRFCLFARRRARKRCLNHEEFNQFATSILIGNLEHLTKLFWRLATRKKNNKPVVFYRKICIFMAFSKAQLDKVVLSLARTLASSVKMLLDSPLHSILRKYLLKHKLKPKKNAFQDMNLIMQHSGIVGNYFPQEILFIYDRVNATLYQKAKPMPTNFLYDIRVEVDTFSFHSQQQDQMPYRKIYPLDGKYHYFYNRIFAQNHVLNLHNQYFVHDIRFSPLFNDKKLIKQGYLRVSPLACFRHRFCFLRQYLYIKRGKFAVGKCIKRLFIQPAFFMLGVFKHLRPCADFTSLYKRLGYPTVFAEFNTEDVHRTIAKTDDKVILERIRTKYCRYLDKSEVQADFRINFSEFLKIIDYDATIDKVNFNRLSADFVDQIGFNHIVIYELLGALTVKVSERLKSTSSKKGSMLFKRLIADSKMKFQDIFNSLGYDITSLELSQLNLRFKADLTGSGLFNAFVKVSRYLRQRIEQTFHSWFLEDRKPICLVMQNFVAEQLELRKKIFLPNGKSHKSFEDIYKIIKKDETANEQSTVDMLENLGIFLSAAEISKLECHETLRSKPGRLYFSIAQLSGKTLDGKNQDLAAVIEKDRVKQHIRKLILDDKHKSFEVPPMVTSSEWQQLIKSKRLLSDYELVSFGLVAAKKCLSRQSIEYTFTEFETVVKNTGLLAKYEDYLHLFMLLDQNKLAKISRKSVKALQSRKEFVLICEAIIAVEYHMKVKGCNSINSSFSREQILLEVICPCVEDSLLVSAMMELVTESSIQRSFPLSWIENNVRKWSTSLKKCRLQRFPKLIASKPGEFKENKNIEQTLKNSDAQSSVDVQIYDVENILPWECDVCFHQQRTILKKCIMCDSKKL